ncbi:hypothetical protein HH310_12860 [Actinoplanes sp. TBRC 11911]|uniref:hypothetical protein n=1 Tax=Actinoplanes sp. TBRC 11911 TaxID=2729386 RepID=UPI00145F4CC1|nr:hypothetical protein [Actinoplanes sp. TBRC 11911]NMO52085.1 hypothetical protein [Actinoplanes sp. TBRC 11911]
MRKLWYAGATLTGGIFLFGAASPAQADLLPDTGTAVQQADQRLVFGDPAGHRAPDLDPLVTDATDSPNRLPKADVVGADGQPEVPLQRLPFSDLIGNAGRLAPVYGMMPADDNADRGLGTDITDFGLLPLGSPSDLSGDDRLLLGDDGLLGDDRPLGDDRLLGDDDLLQRGDDRSWLRQTEAGAPLLGGLGGLLPEDSLPRSLRAGTVPDTSGLPGGGVALLRPDAPDPAFGVTAPPASVATHAKPAADQPQPAGAAAAPDDPRLHEEPIDGERRSFSSDARPVAGVDREFD